MKRVNVTLCALSAMSASLSAAIVIPDAVSLAGAHSNPASNTGIDHTIDGSGLSATLTDANLSTVTHERGYNRDIQYLTQNAGAPDVLDVTVTYSFTTAIEDQLTTLAFWSYTQANRPNSHASSITVAVNTGSGLSTIGTFNISTPDLSQTSHVADLIDLSSYNLSNVSEVSISLNQANVDSFGEYVGGINEVAFQTQPVPEPGAASLLLISCSGLLLHRRRMASV
ncbi:PEP-CTERM sorting domain-containing protein [Verrucomicrobiaceae bacterium N1E253]|uniref:PEP-CTERM sorting domain-containing protein n=1 Tax=Oceaniferula marina TaxID=2748318 RepID=A0A851GKD3_9BACT|nr:PEP-CTERM sorting domain-containing protein [Oceaniferula marina]NWK57482.1 PEP-CTERM sorting domain-containing protein [Oceaniferula marina]